MTPQEIGLLVALVVIVGYVIAALISRSKSGDDSADIMLEARLPQSSKPIDALIPPAERAVEKNKKRPRRKAAQALKSEANEAPAAVRTQQHHASPKPVSKSAPTMEPTKKDPSVAAQEPVRPVAAISQQTKPEPKPEPEPSPVEVIDPELSGQISELDDRLDAIEKLVASIEESLATFEPLEESPTGEAQAA